MFEKMSVLKLTPDSGVGHKEQSGTSMFCYWVRSTRLGASQNNRFILCQVDENLDRMRDTSEYDKWRTGNELDRMTDNSPETRLKWMCKQQELLLHRQI